jgi:DNA-binding MarR family transcriptional regulator
MKFKIPYDRQELADFLCVDRSALSGELGKMKKEGLLDYSRSEFEIRLPPDK